MDLIKIRLKDLKDFCDSEVYNQFKVKPISPLRTASYIHNPRAHGDDYVLYMLVENNELLAFRTIWADRVYDGDQAIRFGWYSGNWVAPHYRRQGWSKRLFQESYADWEKRVMFTNYAEASKQLYLDSKTFQLLKERHGKRFYLFPDMHEIIKNKSIPSWIKKLAPALTVCCALLSGFKIFFYKGKLLQYTELEQLDEGCMQLLAEKSTSSLYQRGPLEIAWIFQYPWITNKQMEHVEYPFSYSVTNFQIKIVKQEEQGNVSFFFIYTIINKKMKILYYYGHQNDTKQLSNIILDIAVRNRISYLTVLDRELAAIVERQASWFIFSKGITSNIYSSFQLHDVSSKKIFDGDGDNCFT